MAWTAPRNWIASEIVTAALMNTHIRDNETELRAGGIALASGAAGDVPYFSSSTQMARVAGAATGAALISGGTGSAPAWSRQPPLDGILFPATAVPDGNANMLDDYEEGLWTPTDASGAGLSFTLATGHYVKVGRWIFIEAALTYPATGNGSNALIGSFPFASDTGPQGWAIPFGYNDSSASLVSYLPVSATGLFIYTAGGNTRRTNANLSSSTIMMNGFYRAYS